MSKFTKLLLIKLVALLFSGCVNYTKEADTAYLREDWDAAVSYYSQALQKESDPAEINRLKQQLTESKRKGSEEHLENAIAAKNSGNIGAAYKDAKTSYAYQSTNQALTIIHALKVPERDRLLALGESALERNAWDEAISHLKDANLMDKTDKVDQLILRAMREKVLFNTGG
ncbi:MAG: hypothetical protein P8Y45_09970 [Exilibacterium sp.]